MSERVYACARCGERGRSNDTFLCWVCLGNRATRVEQATAEGLHPGDYRAQRALLTATYGWTGWHRRMKGASRA